MSGADSLAPFVGYTKNVESGILLVFYLTVIILLFLASEKNQPLYYLISRSYRLRFLLKPITRAFARVDKRWPI